MNSKTNRRRLLEAGLATATAAAAPALAASEKKPVKKVHWAGGKRPEKTPLYSPSVSYGGLFFISGIGVKMFDTGKYKSSEIYGTLRDPELRKQREECIKQRVGQKR